MSQHRPFEDWTTRPNGDPCAEFAIWQQKEQQMIDLGARALDRAKAIGMMDTKSTAATVIDALREHFVITRKP